ncbi:MAG: aminotransferase class V-fold PLP-dependent enzyme [Pseudomonadota bacterium]
MSDDPAFAFNANGLQRAVTLLGSKPGQWQPGSTVDLPETLPETGLGEGAALERLAPAVIGGAAHLGAAHAFAHMDPPTPWITWAMTLWNAALNQNLLHPDVAPMARVVEKRVVDWLCPAFGMKGGHMTAGSTLANLTAIWAAREVAGIDTVVASQAAHISVEKAAHILGLGFRKMPTDAQGRLDVEAVPDDLDRTALVLTAGTTSSGAIDPFALTGRAAWTHVDAAWAGPLRLSERYADRLAGIEAADSVAISAHKWLFQPKESGLILFRDAARAHEAISFGGSYLATPNVGVLGSRAAIAVPLLATLLAWGRSGLRDRIDKTMDLADAVWTFLDDRVDTELFGPQVSGAILWRPITADPSAVLNALPRGLASRASSGGHHWIRHVAANPNGDFATIRAALERALNASPADPI